MAIKVGDKLPGGTLWELIEEETPGCTIGPNAFKVEDLSAKKRIAIFGLPGAFTPTCSAKHLPGFVQLAGKFKDKKVDEIWCLSVNDAFVMGAWGKDQHCAGKVRMLADGNGEFTKALGLELDASGFGMGKRSKRYAMIVKDGTVEQVLVDESGLKESSAENVLSKL